MKAMVYTRYGPPEVLQLQEVEKPVPGDDQVLVEVRAASLNALDFRRFESQSAFGSFMDNTLIKTVGKVLGADIAGRVVAVGAAVKGFQPGDEVFGVAAGSVGGLAEFACASENGLVLKPSTVTFEEAAAVPVAGITALQALRDKGQVQAGQKVLINGASGGVGIFAVQIAKSLGAEVTAVCSTRNIDMVRGLGADHVIDYTQQDFSRSGQRYHLIVAINGSRSLQAYRHALTETGVYIAVGGSISQVLQAMLLGPVMSRFGHQKLSFMGISKIRKRDLQVLQEFLEAGTIKPVIDKAYPLSEVAEAIHYLVETHARGKVVITPA